MASFTLNWTPIITPNVLGQRGYYRQKSVGGTFLTDGFVPANDLPTSAITVARPGLLDNTVYQFQLANICEDGGPTFNDNGIQEFIDFVCSVPMTYDIEETSITVKFVGLPADINQVQIAFEGKPLETIVVVGGNASHEYTGLTPNTEYTVTAKYGAIVNGAQLFDSVNTCSDTVTTAEIQCGPATNIQLEGQEPNFIWLPDLAVCENSSLFEVDRQITGLYNPADTFYDSITGRMYVGDLFDPNGNIYWFDPMSATGPGDMTYSNAVNTEIYTLKWDTQNRVCYMVGRNTGGMLVYDIASDTVTTLPYGTDGGAFNRIGIYIGATQVYSNYKGPGGNSIVVVNRNTLSVNQVLISAIPNNSRFGVGGYTLDEAAGNIFVVAGSGSSVSTVGVYDLNFSNNITNIVLPVTATWDHGRYWQSIWTDPVDQKVYVGDFGGNTRYVIDSSTYNILFQETIQPREGKSNVVTSHAINPVNNDIYCSIDCMNTSEDSAISRARLINRSTGGSDYMYEGIHVTTLAPVEATGILATANPGVPPWVGGGQDGSIAILNMYAAGDNTGRKITKTLKEVDANNGNIPTGNTKPNLPSDPDYIAPVIDTTTCPVTFTTNCPVDQVSSYRDNTLYFEFSLPSSVINNPAIDIIQIEAFNTDTTVVDGTPIVYNSPFSNYFSGGISGLGGTNYAVRIKYITAPSTVIQTC